MTEIQNSKNFKLMADTKSKDFSPTETSDNNGITDQVTKIFFSKETISNLNKKLLHDSNLQNLSREGKQELITILIKNMKNVYRAMDMNKITSQNFSLIFDQFQKHSINESINDIKNTNIPTQFQQSSTDLKFQRDFKSNPNNGIKIMERPTATKINQPSNSQFNQPSNSQFNQPANSQFNQPSNSQFNQPANSQFNQPSNSQFNQPSNSQSRTNPNDLTNINGVRSQMKRHDSLLDQAFKPIVDEDANKEFTNNYNSRSSKDVESRMSDIQQQRQSEVIKQNRPPTPDFLKSKKTNPDKETSHSKSGFLLQKTTPFDETTEIKNKPTTSFNQPSSNGPPDFKNMNSNEFNNSFNGLSNDTGDNLFSLDNIDKPLLDNEIIEDTLCFEDRLKKLQSDRDTLKAIDTNQSNTITQIDFTSDNFPKLDSINNNNIPQMKSNQVHLQQEQLQQQEQARIQQQPRAMQLQQQEQARVQQQEQARAQQLQQQQEQARAQQLQQQQEQARIQQEQQRRAQQLQEQNRIHQEQEQNRIHQEQRRVYHLQEASQRRIPDTNHTPSESLPFNETNGVFQPTDTSTSEKSKNYLVNEILGLKQENQDLLNYISRLKEEINSDNTKILEIKKQLSSDFDQLKIKNNDFESKFLALTMKEKEVHQLINQHAHLFKTPYLQIDITNTEHKSSFIWHMEPIKDVIGIKLISYSLPAPRFNIEENKNNLLWLVHNNIEIKINVLTGKYTIDDLIYEINNKLETIKLSINNEQKIIIESTDNSIFEIKPTPLITNNLGFISNTIDNNKYISDKTWDLRIIDKVYLYLKNLSETPFGILYFNGQSISQFKFEVPYNLDRLEIMFKDSDGNDYNFYNLSNNLCFLIERLN
jgi:hypothetical protein